MEACTYDVYHRIMHEKMQYSYSTLVDCLEKPIKSWEANILPYEKRIKRLEESKKMLTNAKAKVYDLNKSERVIKINKQTLENLCDWFDDKIQKYRYAKPKIKKRKNKQSKYTPSVSFLKRRVTQTLYNLPFNYLRR